MNAAARHIAREAAVSAAINGVLSLAFFHLAFGGLSAVTVWGAGGYALDFLPQSLAVGFMSALVPGLLFRQALAKGRVAYASVVPVPGVVVLRAVVWAVAALVAGSALAFATLWAAEVDTIDGSAALVVKMFYGAALGAFVTFASLRRMID